MSRRSLIVGMLALSLTVSASTIAVAQTDDRITTGVNAGNQSSSSAGTDGNAVTGNSDRQLPDGIARPNGDQPTTQADPTAASSGPVPPVIPPNPALTGEAFPGALAPTITEETSSGESVIGPPPPVISEDAGEDREGRRNSGNAEASATDGPSTGGAVNETAGSPTAVPASETLSESSGTGACGYPTWLDAQNALETEWSESLADALDPDRDGIACEEAMI